MKPTLTEIEDQLIATLTAVLPAGTLVEAWPEKGLKKWLDGGGLKRPQAVLVHYVGAEFSEPSPKHARIAQERLVTYRLFVVARSLRGLDAAGSAAYALLDACRSVLTGLDLGGPGRLRPAGEEAIELGDALAIFAADFEAELVWLEPVTETGPALTQSTTRDTIAGQPV